MSKSTLPKKTSPQKAILNYCKGCIYDPLAGGTFREQIENCQITHCELYEHRPRSKAVRDKQKQEYLDSLTPEERQLYEEKQLKKAEIFKNRLLGNN